MKSILDSIESRAKEIEAGVYDRASDDYWLAALTRQNADMFTNENRRDSDILNLASWCVAWVRSRHESRLK